jgi:hypothetical protein
MFCSSCATGRLSSTTSTCPPVLLSAYRRSLSLSVLSAAMVLCMVSYSMRCRTGLVSTIHEDEILFTRPMSEMGDSSIQF